MLPVYFAQKAFVLHAGRLLAVRRSGDDPHHPLLWEVPGGRMEAAESLDEHLMREVREETGVDIVPGEPFHVWKWDLARHPAGSPGTVVAVARLCAARTVALDSSGRVADDQLDLMEWIPLGDLRQYRWIPNMLPVLDAFVARTSPPSNPTH